MLLKVSSRERAIEGLKAESHKLMVALETKAAAEKEELSAQVCAAVN